MTDDIDIYRAAHEYIKQYGDGADIQASMMADKLLERGGMEEWDIRNWSKYAYKHRR
jgi:hypothetical protein